METKQNNARKITAESMFEATHAAFWRLENMRTGKIIQKE